MGITYNKEDGKWHADAITELMTTAMNNFISWGQPYDPYDSRFDHNYDDNYYTETPTVQISQQSVIINGYGEGVKAKDFPVIEKLVGSKVSLKSGSYSFQDLKENGLVNEADRITGANLYTSDLPTGTIPGATAMYVHGTVGFALMSDTKFIVKGGKIIEVQARIGAIDDNFDFQSNNIPSELNALVYIAAGPDFLPDGAKVILIYRGEGKLDVITEDRFCFPAGTLITLADGTTKPIEDIRHGDIVLSHDKTGNLTPQIVDKLFTNTTDAFIRLSFTDRDDLIATPGHHFLTETGDYMEIGHLARLGGGSVRIVDTDGSIVTAKAERIVYSTDTAEMFKQAA